MKIVSDGGPENIHHELTEYVSSLVGNIKKLIALKDITFSNSPAETKNRTFKSYYTYDDVENTKQLYDRVEFYVKDVNDDRPSCVLKGFTPTEVHTNTKPNFDFAALRKTDAGNRKEANKNKACGKCDSLSF